MRRHLAAALFLAAAAPAHARDLQLVLEAVDMRGAREGFAIRSFDGLVRSVARTRDGGRSFEDVAMLDRMGLRGARAISSPDGRTVIATGDGWVLRSINGGRTFTRVDVPEDLSYRKVHFSGATATGWLLGVRSDEDPTGAVFTTLDAGRTFRARVAPRDARFRDFAFVDPARGFAVDARGVVRTRDGGASFDVVRDAPPGRYTAIAASGRMVVAAGEARLAVSSDGGERWRQVPSPTDAPIAAISIVGPRRWVIAADAGLSWRTSNEGRDWAQLAPAPGHGAPRFIDDVRAYAGGSEVLSVTADAGDTWQSADPTHRADVDTEQGETEVAAAPTGEAPAEGGDESASAGGPPHMRQRGRGAASASEEPPIEGATEEETEALRGFEGQGVPQAALRRAQRAAERAQKRRGGRRRGGRGAIDWIEGAQRSQRR